MSRTKTDQIEIVMFSQCEKLIDFYLLQAYANFGKRVRTLQSKLVEDKLPELKLDSKALLAAADLSPIPSPDYDAPSPQSGELELVLPDEQQQQLQQQQRSPVVDFNSRLDSMRSQMVRLKTFMNFSAIYLRISSRSKEVTCFKL